MLLSQDPGQHFPLKASASPGLSYRPTHKSKPSQKTNPSKKLARYIPDIHKTLSLDTNRSSRHKIHTHRIQTSSFVHLCSHNTFLNPPSHHKPHYFLITLDTSNHLHSIVHKQKGSHDCIKAVSEEKMHPLPHISATRNMSSPVYTTLAILPPHEFILAPTYKPPNLCFHALKGISSIHPPQTPPPTLFSYYFRYFQPLAHEQGKTDRACIKAPGDEKMQQHLITSQICNQNQPQSMPQNWHFYLWVIMHSHWLPQPTFLE